MASKSKQSFAKSFEELEEITQWFERDNVDLEEGITKFERGMTLAKDLRVRLQSAEVKIAEIKEKFGRNEGV